MVKADHWDVRFGAHLAPCPFSLGGMHYSALLATSVTSGEAAYVPCMTGNCASCCRALQAQIGCREPRLCTETPGWRGAGAGQGNCVACFSHTSVLVTGLGLVMLFLHCSGGRAAPVSHLYELQEPWGLV